MLKELDDRRVSWTEYRSWDDDAGKVGRPFLSPIDVRLSEYDSVQPDLIVVCEQSQIRPTHIEGAPKLAVEILSPGTQRHDRVRPPDDDPIEEVRESSTPYWTVQ